MSCCLTDHFQLAINERNMLSGDQVMPFPCLATQERQSAYNCPCQPFDHTFLVSVMTRMYCQHHRNRADDQYKGHYTHKCQWKVGMTSTWKCIEHHVRIRPEILAETDGSIGDQESAKRKSIAH